MPGAALVPKKTLAFVQPGCWSAIKPFPDGPAGVIASSGTLIIFHCVLMTASMRLGLRQRAGSRPARRVEARGDELDAAADHVRLVAGRIRGKHSARTEAGRIGGRARARGALAVHVELPRAIRAGVGAVDVQRRVVQRPSFDFHRAGDDRLRGGHSAQRDARTIGAEPLSIEAQRLVEAVRAAGDRNRDVARVAAAQRFLRAAQRTKRRLPRALGSVITRRGYPDLRKARSHWTHIFFYRLVDGGRVARTLRFKVNKGITSRLQLRGVSGTPFLGIVYLDGSRNLTI